jgi:membrane associated rhomboid family serine protease
MKFYWQRFLAVLTPGVRILLILQTTVFIAVIVGGLTHTLDLYRWLAPTAPDVWHGQIWRLATHALLPGCPLNFVTNCLAMVMLGSMLERRWTRHELWLFCGVAAIGAGFAAVLLAMVSPPPLIGPAPMVFALLIAWDFTSSQEMGIFPLFGQATVRQMVLLLAVASCLAMLFTGGLFATLVMASGGLTGWFYLRLRQKLLWARTGRASHSGRINRLEL